MTVEQPDVTVEEIDAEGTTVEGTAVVERMANETEENSQSFANLGSNLLGFELQTL